DRGGGDANIVRQPGPRHQPPVPDNACEFGKRHTQADGDHHFDERNRDENVDYLVDCQCNAALAPTKSRYCPSACWKKGVGTCDLRGPDLLCRKPRILSAGSTI